MNYSDNKLNSIINEQKYKDLTADQQDLAIINSGNRSTVFILLRYLIHIYKCDDISINPSLGINKDSSEEIIIIIQNWLRDQGFIVKATSFSFNNIQLLNGQTLIIFEEETFSPYLAFSEIGVKPQYFDASKASLVTNTEIKKNAFTERALLVIKPKSDNNQSIISLLQFGSQGLGKTFIVMLLSLLLAAILGLCYPLILSYLIDTAIPEGQLTTIYQFSYFYAFIIVAFIAAQFSAIFIFLFADTVIDIRLQVSTITRLFNMPINFFKKYRSGDLMARSQAITQIRGLLGGSLIDTLVHSSILLTSMLAMLLLNWKLAILVLVISLLYVIGASFFGYLEANSTVKQLEEQGLNIGYIFTVLKSFFHLRSEKRQPLLESHFAERLYQQLRYSFRSERYGQYADLIDSILRNIGIFAILVVGHIFTQNSKPTDFLGPFSAGRFVAFISVYSVYIDSIYRLSRGLSRNLSTISALWKRSLPIFQTNDETELNTFKMKSNIKSIAINDLKFKYESQTKYFLDNFNFSANEGETISISGDTGSGKTTLVRLILGFEKPIMGNIECDKVNLSELDIFQYRSKIGCILQSRDIIPGFLKDYLLNGDQFTESDVLEAFDALGFLENYKEFPLGLNTPLAYGGYNFPSEFRELLMIVRSIMSRPNVWIADDSLYAINVECIQKIRTYLGNESIIILVSNRKELIEYSTRKYNLKLQNI